MSLAKPQQRPQAVTMRDVARAANVSQSTVSRILGSSPSMVPISDETREKVLAVIEELGYQPNQYARSLRGTKVNAIAMLIADISNPFYHPMVRAVQDIAFQQRFDVMIANSDHSREKELLFCESILRRPVDGIAIIPYHLTDVDLDNLMARTGVVISAVGNHIKHPNIDVTYADDDKATYHMIHWLIETKGHRRIAMICADHKFPVIVRRFGAFRRAMKDAGLAIPPEYVVEGDWTVESGRDAMKRLLRLPNPPTAIFAASDIIAMGAMEAAHALHVRIPEDVAVVGFDNIQTAEWVHPSLTTVAQFPDQMGCFLANSLFERLQGEYTGPGRRFEVPCQMIERESA